MTERLTIQQYKDQERVKEGDPVYIVGLCTYCQTDITSMTSKWVNSPKGLKIESSFKGFNARKLKHEQEHNHDVLTVFYDNAGVVIKYLSQ